MRKCFKKGIWAFLILAVAFVILPKTVFAGTLDTTLDFTGTTQDMSGDGYKWTQADKTLTLQDLDLDVASGKGIVLPDGASLVLKGENHITTDAGTMIEAKGSLKIDGGGSLIGYSNGKSDDYYGIVTGGGDLEIGKCKLDLHIKPDFVAEVISTVKDKLDIGGAMTFKKGADVTVGDDPAEGEIHRSWGVCTGKYGYKNKKCGDLTIEEGATLKAHGSQAFLASYGCNVTISGTLDTTGCTDEDSVVAANVLTYDNVKVDGTLKLLANQYLDTRGTNLTINAKEGSTGSVFNPDMLSAWIYSDKRGFNKSWSTWINRSGLKKLHIAKGAVLTVIPTGEIKEPDNYGGYDIINQILKLAPESLADLSGGGYVQVEKDGVAELNLEGATVEEVQKLNMFCGKVKINGTEVTMHAGGKATCKEAAVCDVCKESYGERNLENHEGSAEWVTTKTEHTKKYPCCGKIVVATEKHEWKDGKCEKCGYECVHAGGEADCQQAAVCTICGKSYGDCNPDIHKETAQWITTETEHTSKYPCCGKEAVATEKHEWKDGTCEECGYVCVHTGGTATCAKKAVCTFCGSEYGELNPKRHSVLEHVGAKKATKNADGNIEYWCCEGCHKYYNDAAATVEITKEATKIAANTGTQNQQSTENNTNTTGNTITKANTKIKGKTKTKTNTNTKANTKGNTKTSSGATANTGTSESPNTGDQNNPALAFVLMSVSGVILLGLVIVERRRRKANGSL